MALPNYPITPIPDTAPAAVPELWNSKFREIDQNFLAVDIITGHTGDAYLEAWDDENSLLKSGSTDVTIAVSGDDSIDVTDTSGLVVGEEYVIYDSSNSEIVTVSEILSGQRFIAASSLSNTYNDGKLSSCNMTITEGESALAETGDVYFSKSIEFNEAYGSNGTVLAGCLIVRANKLVQVETSYSLDHTWYSVQNLWTKAAPGGDYTDYAFVLNPYNDINFKITALSDDTVIYQIHVLATSPKQNKIPPITVLDGDPIPGYLFDKIVGSPEILVAVQENEIKGKYITIKLPEPTPAPTGVILFSLSDTLPADTTAFNEANGKYIMGSGNIYYAQGGEIKSATIASSTAGGHVALGVHALTATQYAQTRERSITASSLGEHSHNISLTFNGPKFKAVKLCAIMNDIAILPITLGYLFYGSTLPSNFETVAVSSLYLKAGSINSLNSVDDYSASVAASGLHNHPIVDVFDASYGNYPISGSQENYLVFGNVGSHNHSNSPSITYDFPYKKLKLIKPQTGASITETPVGVIAMVTSLDVIPRKWYLCDGTNGTIDLRDKLILLDTAGLGENHNATPYLTFNLTIATDSWNHSHTDSVWTNNGYGLLSSADTIPVGAGNVSHNHTMSQQTYNNYLPPYYPLYFIEYRGV